jgi:hypothetical protein
MALSPALSKLVSQSKNKYAGSGGKTSKPKEGRNTYRLVYKLFNGDERFWRDLGVHWIKAALDAKPIAVVGDCDIVYQKPSVIKTAIDMAISNAVDEDSKKLYEEWKARPSVVINVINRGEGDNLEVLELTTTTFGKVLDIIQLYEAEGQDVLDPNQGYDIVITKSGKGLQTNYDVAVAPLAPGKTFKPVTKDQLDRATNLDDFIAQNYFRGEEQKALNAIAQIAGIRVPQLTSIAGATTPVASLTSPSAVVADAKVTTPAAPIVVDELEERRKQILARQAAMAAELAALENPAPAAPPVTGAAPAPLSQSEQDALLDELDNLGS